LNAQADTLIETASPHLLCPHCGNEHPVKRGRSGGLQRYRCDNPVCHKTFNILADAILDRLMHNDHRWALNGESMRKRLQDID